MGERSRAALSLSRLPRLSEALGIAGRSGLGACPRLLPRSVQRVQRRSAGQSAPPPGARDRGSIMTSWPHPRRLITCDAVGGVWSYSTTLACALAERGCEVLLVT